MSFDSEVPVGLTGRFDAVSAGAMRERLHRAARSGTGPLLVDLSGVDLIDATGLGVLVGTYRLAEELGRPMALRNTPERLARLLRVTRLDRILPTVPSGGPSRDARSAGAVSHPMVSRHTAPARACVAA